MRDAGRINAQDKGLDSFGPRETSSGNSPTCCLWLDLIMLMRESPHKPAPPLCLALDCFLLLVPLGEPCPSVYKLKGRVTCGVLLGLGLVYYKWNPSYKTFQQDQQDHPTMPTNPDRRCTYLVLRAHRMGQDTSKTNPRVSPSWPRRLPDSDQHSEEHWPGGVKIKMTLGFATPRESCRLLGKCKTTVGPSWRSFIQSELSRGSHKPNRVRNAKSRNITPV